MARHRPSVALLGLAIALGPALVVARDSHAFAILRRHTTVTVGRDVDLQSVQSFSASYLLGTTIVISRSCDLRKFGVIAREGGPRVVFALYDDASGKPGALIASTPPTTLVAGRNDIEVHPAPLHAGTYWLMKSYDVTAQIAGDNTYDSPVRYVSLPFGAPLPTTFPSDSSSYEGAHWNEYLVVVE